MTDKMIEWNSSHKRFHFIQSEKFSLHFCDFSICRRLWRIGRSRDHQHHEWDLRTVQVTEITHIYWLLLVTLNQTQSSRTLLLLFCKSTRHVDVVCLYLSQRGWALSICPHIPMKPLKVSHTESSKSRTTRQHHYRSRQHLLNRTLNGRLNQK